MNKFQVGLLSFMIVLFGIYSYLVLTSVPTATAVKLGIGTGIIRLAISFSFALPLFISFYFGCWSSRLLFKAKFRSFAMAVLLLTLIMLCNSFLGQIRNHFFAGAETQKIFIIVTNYLYTFGHLIGFSLIFFGTRHLLSDGFKKWNIVAGLVVISLIGALYALMLFTNPDRTVATIPGTLASHYLSDPLILLTIFLPTLMGWFFGVVAAFSLADVFRLPKQILYGLLFIIFSSMVLEVILSIGTKRVLDIGLPLVFGVLYLFVAALVVGNWLIVVGAKKITSVA